MATRMSRSSKSCSPLLHSLLTPSSDPPHPSGDRKDGKPGDPREHMTLVGHHGQPVMGDWHHLYNDGTHQALPPSRDPKPWSHLL